MSVYPEELYPGCPCLACDGKTWPESPLGFVMRMRMSLCPTCGNKRCPGAADHTNECSGSNEPGQPGSLYPAPRLDDTRTVEERIADFWESVEDEKN